jgi:hypothetical protein
LVGEQYHWYCSLDGQLRSIGKRVQRRVCTKPTSKLQHVDVGHPALYSRQVSVSHPRGSTASVRQLPPWHPSRWCGVSVSPTSPQTIRQDMWMSTRTTKILSSLDFAQNLRDQVNFPRGVLGAKYPRISQALIVLQLHIPRVVLLLHRQSQRSLFALCHLIRQCLDAEIRISSPDDNLGRCKFCSVGRAPVPHILNQSVIGHPYPNRIPNRVRRRSFRLLSKTRFALVDEMVSRSLQPVLVDLGRNIDNLGLEERLPVV